jgi:hypothetical protein
MLYAFPTGILSEERYKLQVKNVTLEVIEGQIKAGIANPCLNGKFTVKGADMTEMTGRGWAKLEGEELYGMIVIHLNLE